jgi:hypothetical protein
MVRRKWLRRGREVVAPGDPDVVVRLDVRLRREQELDVGREYADHLGGTVEHRDRTADDRAVAAVTALPEAVAQHDDGGELRRLCCLWLLCLLCLFWLRRAVTLDE